MKDLFEYSTPELVRMLGTRFKEYRMRCNLTQKEVSELSGVGLTTIHKFENGTAGNLSLSTFILLLKVVGQINSLDDILPELLAGINVYMGIFNVFFQCEMREWGQGVTDIPKVHIVFPLVEVLQIFGFECPDQNVFILHHKFCHLFYGQYSYL